jgi:glucoamylase
LPDLLRRVGRVATSRITIVVTAVVLAAAGVTATLAVRQPPGVPGLLMQGIAADPCTPGRVLPVPVGLTGRFEPGSSVLRTAGGVLTAAGITPVSAGQARCDAAAVRAGEQWLGAGLVPGTGPQRAMAARALLDLRLSVRPDGAVVAAWHGAWRYAWPRDSSWVAAALAATDHLSMAFKILGFLQRVQAPDGTWAARYHLDGTPVRDGRPAELDAVGWVPWAVWSWAQAAGRGGLTAAAVHGELAGLWPMVTAAANAAARSLTADGLPGPAMDYWENSVKVTLGTAAPLLAGLRAAADLAPLLRDGPAGRRWAAAAARLSAAIRKAFGGTGYRRTPSAGSGADAAVAFLGPPLAPADPADPAVRRAAGLAQATLRQRNGGLVPGGKWTGSPDVAWTPETAFFALFDAGTGQPGPAAGLLSWLAGHRTKLGELAEQVSASGKPVSVAPLAWTDAVVLLALLDLDHDLDHARSVPTVPVPPTAERRETFVNLG